MSTKMQTVKILSVDERLANHLKRAEEELIEAVKLFALKDKPVRHHDFLTRLTRAQEIVTCLHGEELIRIRGLFKPTRVLIPKGKRK